jgi:hypothetical protein
VTKTLTNPNDSRHLFIVRFWREESDSAPGGQWRGSVEHIPTGQRAHFVSLEVLNTFISQRLTSESAETINQDGG